jgi:hypothetical protein
MTDTRMDDVAGLFDKLPYLDRGELLALAGAQKQQQEARRGAWRAVEEAASRRDGGRGLDRVRGEVASWATHLGAIVGDEAGSGLADLMLADVRRAAAPTILDAAAALLYQDDLTESDRSVLLAPWRSVTGS